MNNTLKQYWYLPTAAVLRFDAKRFSQDQRESRGVALAGAS